MLFINNPRDIFKHISCKLKGGHSYKLQDEFMIDWGMRKMREYRCEKCGHVRFDTV